jgi:hypothetical protein
MRRAARILGLAFGTLVLLGGSGEERVQDPLALYPEEDGA